MSAPHDSGPNYRRGAQVAEVAAVVKLKPRVRSTRIRVRVKATMLFAGTFKSLEEELNDHEFNTFRAGSKWITKLRVGDVVEMAHVEKDRRKRAASLGHAIVTDLAFGTLRDMLDAFATENHATSDPDELRGVLRATYGKNRARSRDLYTVVRLVSLTGT